MHFLYDVFNPSEGTLLKPFLPPRVPFFMGVPELRDPGLFLVLSYIPGCAAYTQKITRADGCKNSWIMAFSARDNEVINCPNGSSDHPGTKLEWMAQPGFVHDHVLGPMSRKTQLAK